MPDEKTLNAIALLKADHRKVEDLFAELEAAKGAAKKRAAGTLRGRAILSPPLPLVAEGGAF